MKEATPLRPVLRTLMLTAVLAAVAACGWPSAATAQAGMGSRFPIEYRSWEIKDSQGRKETISQLYVPVITTLRISPAVNLVLSSSGARTETSSPATDDSAVNGLADLKAQLFYTFGPGDRLLFLAGVDLPTGKTELTLEEFQITRAAAAPLLGMKQRSLGGGLDVNGGFGWSIPLAARVNLALAAGVTIPGSFVVLDDVDSADYQPASRGSVSIGLEFRSARWDLNPKSLSLKATARAYGADQADGHDVFEEGDQVDVSLTARSDLGPLFGSIRSRVTLKEDNIQITPAGDSIVEAVSMSAGSGTFLQVDARWAQHSIQPGLSAQWRWVTDDQIGSRNGYTLGVGPTISGSIAGANWFKVGALYLQGRAGEGEQDLDLSGFAISVNFIWRVF